MSDPLPTDATADAPTGAECEAKIEHLLLTGLDHYFDGDYDRAINIWTRALFFDRGHVRARTYIERARSALAERQRESEELLQRGLAAFDRGASTEARRLLEAAITRGAPRDEALSVLDRIQRLHPPTGAVRWAEGATEPALLEPPAREAKPLGWLLAMGVVLAGVAIVVTLLAGGWLPVQVTWRRPLGGVLTSADPDPVLLRPGERALGRARHLAGSGRFRDALVSLDEVTMTDEEKPAADRLRAEIQRQLLALQTSGPSAAAVAGR